MAELEAKFGSEIEAELIKGDRGAFEITLDGELIYSKLKTHAFPRYAEIPALVLDRM
ncbi:Rdx family protein [Enhygromyxa salina]|uniref:Rdx family protein n=1 Tax=Enhygromyxa salina TaxID=215803 RepID=A0A2S9XKU8_9BACT|nr:Rdx family protein [Enhygromyxa salina]